MNATGDVHLQLLFVHSGFMPVVLSQSRGEGAVPYTGQLPAKSSAVPPPAKMGRMTCVRRELIADTMVLAHFEPAKGFPALYAQNWGSAVTDVEAVVFAGGRKTVLRQYEFSELELTRRWPGFHACMRDRRVFFNLTISDIGWEVRSALVLFHVNELPSPPGAPARAPDQRILFATHWGHVTPTTYWGCVRETEPGRLGAIEHVPSDDDVVEDAGLPPSSGLIAFDSTCCAYEKSTPALLEVALLSSSVVVWSTENGEKYDFGRRAQMEMGIRIDFDGHSVHRFNRPRQVRKTESYVSKVCRADVLSAQYVAYSLFASLQLAFPGVGFHSEPPQGVVWIESTHYRVPAWHLVPHDGRAPRAVIIYCHGNAMSISQMEAGMQQLANELRCVLVVPEIPGLQYDWGRLAFKGGAAAQLASEASYFEAAKAAVDYARAQHPNLRVVVWGQSLGSGAACELGVTKQPDGIVLQSPLLSCVRVAFNSFPTLPLTDIMVNIGKAPKFRCPTLIMHGTQDEVIHVDHGKRLAAAVAPDHLMELALMEGAGHNDMEMLCFDQMVAKVSQLLDRVVAAAPALVDGQQ